MGFKYYAVRVGRETGIYTKWPECEKQVKGFTGASFKGFNDKKEALEFIGKGKKVQSSPKKRDSSEEEENSDRSSEESSSEESDSPSDEESDNSSSEEESVRVVVATPLRAKITGKRRLVVYTDGASKGNPGYAGAGVHFSGKRIRNERGSIFTDSLDDSSRKYEDQAIPLGKTTNNYAELYAIHQALEIAEDDLHIVTDSELAFKTFTVWVDKQWLAKPGRANVELITKIYDLIKGKNITFEHVLGHNKTEGNEQADQLANQGVTKNFSGKSKK